MSATVDLLPHRPSLLDRRASNNFSDLPDRLSVSALLRAASPSSSAAAAAAGAPYLRTAPKKPSAALLPFIPLTPIMASPLLTPDVAHAPTPAAMLDSAARQPTSGHDPPQEQDYISHQASPSNPTWTTSPPTPPPKPSPSARAASSPPPSPLRAARGRTKSHSQSAVGARSRSASSRRSGPRPASLASYAPTPLSRSYSPSPAPSLDTPRTAPVPAAAPSLRRLSLPADLSKPLPPRPPFADGAPKELPPVPSTNAGSARIDATEEEETLLPSLSRRSAATSRTSSASVAALADGETGTLRGRARKLFSLADDEGKGEGEGEGDLSDTEERARGASVGQKRGSRERTESGQELAEEQAREREREKERAERMRRYHALMELLTTEVGYLLDLRVLVTVYLDQLLLLSASSPSAVISAPVGLPTPPLAPPLCLGVPLPSSGRSMTSLSALSIPSLFPSSRSSFFHHSPAASPSPSTTDFLANSGSPSDRDKDAEDNSSRERSRQSSGVSTCNTSSTSRERERERERDKENLERAQAFRPGRSSRQPAGPVLAEKDVRAVCRNAQELLRFHERFVGELRAAVGLVGFGMVLGGEESWIRGVRGEGEGEDEGVGAELIEHAVEVVATKFVSEAASFSIYETFCPGHAAATDLLRRAHQRWPAIWEAYEQRCTLLVSRNPDSTAPVHDRGRSDGVAASASPASPTSEEGGRLSPEPGPRKKRRHSTPAPSFSAQPTLASTHEGSAEPGSLPFPSSTGPLSAVTPAFPTSPSERWPRAAGPKLKFMDYLIKPVQRICKYPLLLDQLRPKRADATSARQAAVDEAVRLASEAMRGVVSRVNRASEKEAHNLRSALIASRIVYPHSPSQGSSGGGSSSTTLSSAPSAYPPSATSSSSSGSSSSHGHSASASSSSASSCISSPATPGPSTSTVTPSSGGPAAITPLTPLTPLTITSPRATGLTAEFVSSLGPCTLAGALDVLQHPAHRAKYLGAFLYAGGYCILVKVVKGGRAYEPRHWFPLGGVEVVDVEEDDPSFPYSFHVTANGHDLQLAASCPQEKAIWLSAINDALSTKPSWVNEPLSSFQADDKSPLSSVEDAPQESPSGLPTIQSLSELEKHGESATQAIEAPATTPTSATTPASGGGGFGGKGQLKYSRTLSRLDSLTQRQDPSHPQLAATFSAALSRRSSTASVKAFFAPIAFDSARVARPSAQARAHVEQSLHDLFSEPCLAARAQAQMRGEELFQVRLPAAGAGGAGSGGGVLVKRQGSGLPLPRSNSGLSLANAMGLVAAKRRYDSVLVSRRKASMDGVPDLPVPGESASAAGAEMNVSTSMHAGAGGNASASVSTQGSSGPTLAGRAKSLAVRRQKKLPASIASAITSAIAQQKAEVETQKRAVEGGPADVRSPEALSLDSPPAASHCSSVSSHPGLDSLLPSPTEASPLPIPVPGLSPNGTLRQSDILQAHPAGAVDAKPKRARSMVSNVRSFFRSPSRDGDAPSIPLGLDTSGRASPAPPLLTESPTSEYATGIVQWLRRTSIRRRDSGSSGSRSTTDDQHYHHRQQQQQQQNLLDGRRPLPTRNSSDGVSVRSAGPSGSLQIPPSPAHRVAFSAATATEPPTPKRRRSLFVPSSRSRDRVLASHDDGALAGEVHDAPSAHANMPSRRSIKNIFLFQRSNSLTPMG
ncbi:hypothetical protein BD414DRAFT_10781 [Trametes punicea]|nr:hypothetical protein BD414DRAFT_10781 [Trametes punicea]